MKTKTGTEVAHVTRDSDTTFKVKRSKVNLHGAGAYCGGLPHSLFRAREVYYTTVAAVIVVVQVLGLLVTYFVLVVQFANPSADVSATSPAAPSNCNCTETVY